MKSVFTRENGYRLIFEDAQQKQTNQITAIRRFIQREVDYIVLAPVTETGWDTVLTEAKEAGIPVIIVDRKVDVSDDSLFTCWVGSDFELEGMLVCMWMSKFFDLKGIITEMLNKLGIRDLKFVSESDYGIYHPGRCAHIIAKHIAQLENGPLEEEVEIGIMGEVHPEVADKYGIGAKAYAAELSLENIIQLADMTKVFKPLPKYPSITGDIALLVDESVQVGQIEEVIRENAEEILRDVKLFDIYRGIPIPKGKKSLAFTLTYRHDDRTLTDEDVVKVHTKVLESLENKLNAVLREM